MRRYWVDAENISGDFARLQGEAFHHIFSVCRQEVGSHFEILDGSGQALLVEVTRVGKADADGKIIERRPLPKAPAPRIVLALSVPRFPVFESVIEKCVELGVSQVRPFFSAASFVRSKDKISDGRMERWSRIILSATRQSGRGDLMELTMPQDLKTLRADFAAAQGQGLIAYEGETPVSLSSELSNRIGELKSAHEIWLFVGGEGGFFPNEVEEFASWGVRPVTLGSQVLRVETACIALVSILKCAVGHLEKLESNYEPK